MAEWGLDLEEASAIEDYLDDLLHVVDLGALLRNDVEDPFLIFARAFRHRGGRRQLAIVARHVAEEGADGGHRLDRQSVVSGKSVSVRVDAGGRRIFNKTQHDTNRQI